MLESQGEQLNRIEKGLDDINADMKEAEKHITQMEKWCGLCLMPWNRRKKIKDVDDAKWETNKDGVVIRQPPSSGDAGATSSGPYIERITNDAREDEMEDNMQQVGSVLGNLKNMATDMGQEIDRQNKQLDKIGAKVINIFLILFSFFFHQNFLIDKPLSLIPNYYSSGICG